MSYTATYRIWKLMLRRCGNPNAHDYARYGARGITVCESWLKFENFYADMGERPTGLTIERIDNEGPYSPSNCRWASWEEQANNRRKNRSIKFRGKTMTVSQWAKEFGYRPSVIFSRLNQGWSMEQALTRPVRPRRPNTPIR